MDHLSPESDDFLEDLYARDVEGKDERELKEDDRVIGELLRRGSIKKERGRWTLTKEGRKEAEGCVRRHRLAERMMHDLVDIRGAKAEEAACEFEHTLHHGIAEHVCTLLGHPRNCPHGRPIPPGPCCKERKGQALAAVVPLSEMKCGEKGTIAYLCSCKANAVQKLMALGALPGSDVSVIQTFPSIVFQVGQTQLAVDKTLAEDIYVRRARE